MSRKILVEITVTGPRHKDYPLSWLCQYTRNTTLSTDIFNSTTCIISATLLMCIPKSMVSELYQLLWNKSNSQGCLLFFCPKLWGCNTTWKGSRPINVTGKHRNLRSVKSCTLKELKQVFSMFHTLHYGSSWTLVTMNNT